MSQKLTGTITRWQDEKGFGFIQSEQSNKELFFHISDYRASFSNQQRPTLQENVIFELGTDKKGQPCAKNVQQASFVQKRQQQRQAVRQAKQTNEIAINFTLIFGVVFLLALAGLFLAKILPVWVMGWYVAITIATFAMYAHDKNSAQTNSWRVQESSLHKLSLLGGWVGAGVAHKTLRHKSQKPEFRQRYYLTVVGNLVLLGVLWYFKLR